MSRLDRYVVTELIPPFVFGVGAFLIVLVGVSILPNVLKLVFRQGFPALPALKEDATLLMVSCCGGGLGSQAYTELMTRWSGDWRGFLAHLAANRHETKLDQWELQMQCRVLDRIGIERLWFVSDGIPAAAQRHLAVTPILGAGPARTRAQRAIDGYLADHPGARIAVIPDGPYTMPRDARAPG